MDILTIFFIEMDPLINCQLLIYCEKTSTANCPRKIYWINLTYFNNPLAPVYGGMRENFKGPPKNYDLKQLFKFDLNFQTVQWKTINTKEGGRIWKGRICILADDVFCL